MVSEQIAPCIIITTSTLGVNLLWHVPNSSPEVELSVQKGMHISLLFIKAFHS